MVRTSAWRAERSEVLERSERTEGRRFESGPAHQTPIFSLLSELFEESNCETASTSVSSGFQRFYLN